MTYPYAFFLLFSLKCAIVLLKRLFTGSKRFSTGTEPPQCNDEFVACYLKHTLGNSFFLINHACFFLLPLTSNAGYHSFDCSFFYSIKMLAALSGSQSVAVSACSATTGWHPNIWHRPCTFSRCSAVSATATPPPAAGAASVDVVLLVVVGAFAARCCCCRFCACCLFTSAAAADAFRAASVLRARAAVVVAVAVAAAASALLLPPPV